MPIYEYHCLACGTEFEKLVYGQMAVTCPRCAAGDVSRLLSKFGLKSGDSFAGSAGGGGCGCAAGGGCGCR
ncbi:MAG TPA: zinc ribbon domain-containing protein [Methylomirabilota bacterium]|nr:zinc ribbon domain-containing protein [Methylomirabilota bacterium]